MEIPESFIEIESEPEEDSRGNRADISLLKNFFGAYFHQDCFENDETWEQVVERFLREGYMSDELLALGQDIRAYVALLPDDDLEHALFRDLGCDYNPRADDMTARSRMIAVASMLESAAQNRQF